MSKKSLNVALVGLSTLGHSIARNIAFKSRAAVYLQLYNPSNTRKMRTVCDAIWEDGAQCAIRMHTDKRTLLKWSDVVIFATPAALTGDLLTLSAKSGEHQLPSTADLSVSMVDGVRPGQIFIDHSANDTAAAKEVAAAIAARGGTYLDVPYNGNAAQAKQGTLTLMAGGPLETFNKVLPLLRLYAESITHLGDVGAGVTAKMILQQLVALHSIAAAEAMTVAHHAAIDESKLLSLLDASWASSVMLRRDAPLMEKLLRNPDDAPPEGAFCIKHVYEDLKMLVTSDSLRQNLRAKGKEDLQLPFTSTAFDILEQVVDAGMGQCEMAALVHFLGLQKQAPVAPSVEAAKEESRDKEPFWKQYARKFEREQESKKFVMYTKKERQRAQKVASKLADQQWNRGKKEAY